MSHFFRALQWLPTATGVHPKLCGGLFSLPCLICSCPISHLFFHSTVHSRSPQAWCIYFLMLTHSRVSLAQKNPSKSGASASPSESLSCHLSTTPPRQCRHSASLSLHHIPTHCTVEPCYVCLHSCFFLLDVKCFDWGPGLTHLCFSNTQHTAQHIQLLYKYLCNWIILIIETNFHWKNIPIALKIWGKTYL